jgi:hypothetical protein
MVISARVEHEQISSVNVKPLISALVPLDKGIQDGFERMLKPEKDV